ncbi:MAG: hypothetical protein ACRCV0_00415, partial [Brevinema sp.]
ENMALNHMFDHVQNETKKEVEEHINSIKVSMAKKLIAFGEEEEKQLHQKKERLISQLMKKEEVLKSEQEFQYKAKVHAIENMLADQVLDFLKVNLLEFANSNQRYYQILLSWFRKALNLMQKQQIVIHVADKDQQHIQALLNEMDWHYTFEVSATVKAGFIINGMSGETIDLSFDTLFQERKEYLLQSAMSILKENS